MSFQRAFTRIESLIAVGTVFLLLAIVLPALAHDRARASRIACANNLRQIGVALQLWGGDHGDQLLWNASIADGGTRLHPLSANAWIHYASLSNELASAKVLLCQSDTGTPAREFSGNPTAGYLHPNFRNQATSYFLNAHPNGSVLQTPFFYGNDLLLGDRNIPINGYANCSVLASAATVSVRPVAAGFGWRAGLHGPSVGNLLLFDGQTVASDDLLLRSLVESGFLDDFAASSRLDICLPR